MPGILNWDLGDSSNNVNSNSPIHTYSSAGTKNVVVKQGTTVSAEDIVYIDMSSDDLVGTLDISCFTNLNTFNVNTNRKLTKVISPVTSAAPFLWRAYDCSLNGILDVSGLTGLGVLQVNNNSNLTQILNPIHSGQFDIYQAPNCNLTGILDLSGLTGLGGNFNVDSNLLITQILNPDSSGVFTYYSAYGCDLTGTLDMSGLHGLGGNFQVSWNPHLNYIINPVSSISFASGGYGVQACGLIGTIDVSGLTGLGGGTSFAINPSLNYILNPVSSQTFGAYHAYSCNLLGTLDVSGLTGLGGYFELNDNPNLTGLILPNTLTKKFAEFNVRNCSLNIASIDAILAKLHILYDTYSPTANLTLYADGSHNSWPTDGSSNVNYLGIKSAFLTAGKTLSIWINYPPAAPEVPLFSFITNASTSDFDPLFSVT